MEWSQDLLVIKLQFKFPPVSAVQFLIGTTPGPKLFTVVASVHDNVMANRIIIIINLGPMLCFK